MVCWTSSTLKLQEAELCAALENRLRHPWLWHVLPALMLWRPELPLLQQPIRPYGLPLYDAWRLRSRRFYFLRGCKRLWDQAAPFHLRRVAADRQICFVFLELGLAYRRVQQHLHLHAGTVSASGKLVPSCFLS